MKKKIAWLHPHFLYWTGGTKYILAVVGELSKKYDVTVFTEGYSDEIKKDFNRLNINVVKISNISTNKMTYWVFFPFILISELIILKNRLPKYYRIVSSMFPMNVISNILSRDNHVQFVFEPFAFFHDKKMVNGYPFLIRVLMNIASLMYGWIDVYYTKISKVIMTVNLGVSKWIKKIYKKSSIPAYLIVNTNKFKNVKTSRFKEKYKDRLIVLHSTDLTPLKRTPFIISGFKDVVKEVPNALLLITTPFDVSKKAGQILEYARDCGISNNIEILGFVDNKDLASLYSSARCAVYAGVGDGASACSYFVLEVMSSQTPVVRTSDSTEEVEDNKSGFLFNPRDKKKMITSIVKLLKNKKLSTQMGKEARKRIINVYTTEIVTESFNRAFESV